MSVAWSPGLNTGAYPCAQDMRKGHLVMDEVDVEKMVQMAKEQRLTRVAAFRQLQSVSHQVHLLTDGNMDIDSFQVPPNCHLEPVADGKERRQMWSQARQTNVATIVPAQADYDLDDDETLSKCQPVISHDIVSQEKWWLLQPLLVLGLDQGSIGSAGVAFVQHDTLIQPRFDKIHRSIRDVKLALTHCMRGLFMKTQLHSAYIYALNYKPFNEGGFSQAKKGLLNAFLEIQDHTTCPLWPKYADHIRKETGMTHATDEQVWARLASLDSFNKKGVLVKLSRWFSWNQSCKDYMPEFHATKMILEHHLAHTGLDPDKKTRIENDANSHGTVPNDASSHGIVPENIATNMKDDEQLLKQAAKQKAPDARKEFNLLKEARGGLSLAYFLLSEELCLNVQILYHTMQPIWSWYSRQVESVKTPEDGLRYSQEMARGWMRETHLRDLAKALRRCKALEAILDFPLDLEAEDRAARIMSLTQHFLSNRAWSLARHSLPPECYANMLAPEGEARVAAARKMKREHQFLLQFENSVAKSDHDSPGRTLLWHLQVGISAACRLVMDCFEMDSYKTMPNGSESLRPGPHFLHSLLYCLPDSKIVEDVHNKLRCEAKTNKNKRLSPEHVQEVVRDSGVLESRNIPHTTALTRELFLERCAQTSAQNTHNRFKSCFHKLPKKWHDVMGEKNRKDWPSMTEETLERAAAAWAWLRFYDSEQLGSKSIMIGAAIMSKLALPHLILLPGPGESPMLCLGNATWACLMWPLHEEQVGHSIVLPPALHGRQESVKYYRLDEEGAAQWKHVVDPMAWRVCPSCAVWHKCGVLLCCVAIEEECQLLPLHVLSDPAPPSCTSPRLS